MIVADDAGLVAIRAIVREVLTELLAERAATAAPCEWLSAQQAADLLGCNVRTLARKGCPRHGSGRLVRYRRDEIEQWLARST